MDEVDLTALLMAAQRGDDDAFASIHRQLAPAVYAYLRAVSPEAGDHLGGQVWHAVAARLKAQEVDLQSFRIWLFRLATALVDRGESAQRLRSVPPEGDGHGAGTAVDELLSALPPAQAEVIRLRVLGGLSASDTAAVLGLPLATVQLHQQRALAHVARAEAGS